MTFAAAQTRLELIADENAAQALAQQRAQGIDASSAAEVDLVAYCASGTQQRVAAAKGFFDWMASPIVRVLLNPIAARVHDDLTKYSVVTTGTTHVDFYRGNAAADATTHLSTRYRCLRFSRFVTGESGSTDVGLDFVGAIGLDAAGDAIVIRPLRLFINKAAAKSATGRYGVAFALRADAVWREEFVGHQAMIFEQTIATENVDLRPGSYLKYYPADTTRDQRVPIVPVSFGIDRSRDFGRVDFTLSVAEIGAPPATLALLGEMLPRPEQESLAKLLLTAALALANGQL